MKISIIDNNNNNTVRAPSGIRISLVWVLFLGVIPFDKAALTLFINPSLGEYISYALNAITLILAIFLILNGITKKSYANKLFGKYVLYFGFSIFIYLITCALSSGIVVSRLLSFTCFLFYYLFCMYKYSNVDDLLQDINTALLVVVIVSYILYLTKNPNVFYTENATTLTFKGISINRNSYAEVTMFLVTSSFSIYKKKGNLFFFVFSVGLALYTTSLTKSATAIICIVLLFVSLLLINYKTITKHISFSSFAFIYFIIFVLLILLQNTNSEFFKWITDLFDKDITFTGRTDLWTAAINAISKKPLLGYGYDSNILLKYGMKYEDPHNSVLYILLTQGWVGLLAFFAIIFSVFTKKKSTKLRVNYTYASLLIFLMLWMIRGLVESGFSYSHFLFWITLIMLDKMQLKNEAN